MTNWGIKYSTGHKTVEKNTNLKEIGLISNINCLKVYDSGRRSTSVSGYNSATITINHNLGYRPSFNGYFRDTLSGEVYQIMSGSEDTAFGRQGAEINAHGSSNNSALVFYIYNNNASARNVDIFYEIFIEDLTS